MENKGLTQDQVEELSKMMADIRESATTKPFEHKEVYDWTITLLSTTIQSMLNQDLELYFKYLNKYIGASWLTRWYWSRKLYMAGDALCQTIENAKDIILWAKRNLKETNVNQ